MVSDAEFSTECIPITIVESDGLNHSHRLQEGDNPSHTLNVYGASGDNPVWVTAAKVGQLVRVKDEFKTLTREAILASLGTWKNGSIIDDHNAVRASFNIYGDKFEEPFLCFLLDRQTASDISNSVGGSIDARATEIVNEKVTKMAGVGYSIISQGGLPLCTKEAGCGIPLAAAEVRKAPLETAWAFEKADYTQEQLERACAWVNPDKAKEDRTKEDYKLAYKLSNGSIVWAGVHSAMSALNGARTPVNIPKSDREGVYKILKAAYKLFDKEPPELKASIESKGGDKIMADNVEEKAEVLFSAAQMQDRITAAVAEANEISDNAHKAELADINTTQADTLKEVAETHTTELDEQKTKMFELAKLIESTKTKYGLDDEKVKVLTDAKTPEEVLKCFSELEVKKAAEVAASVKEGEEGDSGVVVASTTPAPDSVTKIEEVGSYDPYTKEWIASYREEVE